MIRRLLTALPEKWLADHSQSIGVEPYSDEAADISSAANHCGESHSRSVSRDLSADYPTFGQQFKERTHYAFR